MRGAQALVLALAFALTTLAVTPATAGTGPPDSDAPRGAGPQWLPQQDWVMQRWLPFDEARLYATVRTTRTRMDAWLADANGRKSIADLARRRGIGRKALVRKLVGKRRRGVSLGHRRRLLRRTNRVVTQSHLSQHILFHTFHLWSVREAARRRLGLSDRQWRRLRGPRRGGGKGLTVVEIARRRGVPLKRLRRPVLRAVAKTYRRGKRAGYISQRQVTRQMREHHWKIQFWPWDPEAAGDGEDNAKQDGAAPHTGAGLEADPDTAAGAAHFYCAL